MAERTVKVRIAVAVDGEGDWQAGAGSYPNEVAMLLGAEENISWVFGPEAMERATYHWVTAELPIPAETEVEGEATDG